MGVSDHGQVDDQHGFFHVMSTRFQRGYIGFFFFFFFFFFFSKSSSTHRDGTHKDSARSILNQAIVPRNIPMQSQVQFIFQRKINYRALSLFYALCLLKMTKNLNPIGLNKQTKHKAKQSEIKKKKQNPKNVRFFFFFQVEVCRPDFRLVN